MSPSLDIPLLTFHGAALPPLVADYDGLLVLPLPGDGRLGVASNEQILIPDMMDEVLYSATHEFIQIIT